MNTQQHMKRKNDSSTVALFGHGQQCRDGARRTTNRLATNTPKLCTGNKEVDHGG